MMEYIPFIKGVLYSRSTCNLQATKANSIFAGKIMSEAKIVSTPVHIAKLCEFPALRGSD